MFLVPYTREPRELSRLFDDTFERFFSPATGNGRTTARSPALDVSESDRAYTVKLEMPGVTKEDVKVSVEGRQVTVQAQNEREEKKKEGDRVLYRERSMTSFSRSFTLPLEVDQVEAGAKLEHGVLTLTLPKRGSRAAAQIAVN
jgi:HSP20 family protein